MNSSNADSILTNPDPHEFAIRSFSGELQQELEAFDRKTSIKYTIGFILLLIGGALFLTDLHIFINLIVIAAGVIFLGTANGQKRHFFRSTVIPHLFKTAAPSLKYNPHSGLSRAKFDALDIFDSYDRYTSEDKLCGTIGKTSFNAAEVHIEKKHKSKDKTYYSTVFRGVVFIADFNKHLQSKTIVLPDVAERCFGKLIGNFFQKMNFTRGSLVKLENPEFEKLFSVYSHDQIEARYILTPKMMENLIALRNNGRNDVKLVFENDHVGLAFSKSRGWLEPPDFGKLARIEVLEQILCELLTVISIVEELDLNTRIWTKQ